jgi:hypothetical protein
VAPGAAVPAAPQRLDPSEEMTAAELATIPEPVAPTAARPADPAARPVALPAAPEPQAGDSGHRVVDPPSAADHSPDDPGGAQNGRPEPSVAGAHVWRVQVFASPGLALADRVSKEAAARLGVTAVIEFEQKLYKVRLGAFASEGDAQALRDRAVREGYPGAFRTRSAVATTDDK